MKNVFLWGGFALILTAIFPFHKISYRNIWGTSNEAVVIAPFFSELDPIWERMDQHWHPSIDSDRMYKITNTEVAFDYMVPIWVCIIAVIAISAVIASSSKEESDNNSDTK